MAANMNGNTNPAYDAHQDELGSEIAKTNGDCPENGQVGKTVDDDEQEGDNRPVWDNGLEFLMSCISMSVGLGNIWRFPFTAYENGGGAFLIPYIIVLFLIGKPMYYLEMALGQFTSRSSVKVWNISPILRGVGVGQILSTASVVSYYCSIMAITMYYMFASCQAELPWARCQPSWGDNCVDAAVTVDRNSTTVTNNNSASSSELYFMIEVLKAKDRIDDGLGLPDWKLTLCLLGSWMVIFFVLMRGVKSSGKAAYFLALFPYVVMLALLVRAVTLEGAGNGIMFFITPKWDLLLSPKVWAAAVTQCFFSLGLCFGPILNFASYNTIKHDIYRDAMIVTTLDTFTSLLAGFTIFGILGNLAHNLGTDDIGAVVKDGTALAFISYPDAIAKFEWAPQAFSVLFFFMLFVLGVGSAAALHSAIVTVICDQFPSLKYWTVALTGSILGFLIGLVYITPGGQWILNLVDYFGGTFLIFALAIVEMAGVFWIYGLEEFCLDVEFMVNKKVTAYWRICWGFITPVLMGIIFVYSLAIMEPLKFGGESYPIAGYVAGWALMGLGLAQLPLWAVWILTRNSKYSILERIQMASKPNESWGPKNKKTKAKWLLFKEEAKTKRDSYNNSTAKHIMYILLGKYR